MNPILLTVGVACVVLAIVGGGGKVLGVELPAIHQPWRIAVLAVAGMGFLLAAYITREPAPRMASAEVTAYRTMVTRICTNMAPRTNAFCQRDEHERHLRPDPLAAGTWLAGQ